jgi:MoxR-like ATPase
VECATEVQPQRSECRSGGEESFSSFILLPLLTLMPLMTSRHMVFIGAPGHGKTTMATLLALLALLAGHSLTETRRSIQHGHPQLTITDLIRQSSAS